MITSLLRKSCSSDYVGCTLMHRPPLLDSPVSCLVAVDGCRLRRPCCRLKNEATNPTKGGMKRRGRARSCPGEMLGEGDGYMRAAYELRYIASASGRHEAHLETKMKPILRACRYLIVVAVIGCLVMFGVVTLYATGAAGNLILEVLHGGFSLDDIAHVTVYAF